MFEIAVVTMLVALVVWTVVSEIVKGRRHSRTLQTIRAEVHSLRTKINSLGATE